MVGGDVIQLRDEICTFWVLDAVEDGLKDQLVFGVDVVVLQEIDGTCHQPVKDNSKHVISNIRHHKIYSVLVRYAIVM